MLASLTVYEETTAVREQLKVEEKRQQEEARMRKHEEEKVMTLAPEANHANGSRPRLPLQPKSWSAANP